MSKVATKILKTLKLEITSTAFKNNESIPKKYTCQGKNINPPFSVSNIPENAKSLALIVDDPDAPSGTWVHWIVWNIPPRGEIKEESIPGIEGINDFNQYHYSGPCPPSGTHHYYFRLYALDSQLPANKNITRDELDELINPHLIGYGELVGVFKKS